VSEQARNSVAADSQHSARGESAPTRPQSMKVVAAIMAFLVPIIAAVVAVALLAGRDDGSSSNGIVWSFVVPAGTKDKQDKGQYVGDILPEQLNVSVGDTVTIRNEDAVVHTFGPFTVRPGETQKMTFTEPGYFFGVCTVGGHDTVTINVS
jgi:plastocyanin